MLLYLVCKLNGNEQFFLVTGSFVTRLQCIQGVLYRFFVHCIQYCCFCLQQVAQATHFNTPRATLLWERNKQIFVFPSEICQPYYWKVMSNFLLGTKPETSTAAFVLTFVLGTSHKIELEFYKCSIKFHLFSPNFPVTHEGQAQRNQNVPYI